MSAWSDGYNSGYGMASKRADWWIVIFSAIFLGVGVYIGWIARGPV